MTFLLFLALVTGTYREYMAPADLAPVLARTWPYGAIPGNAWCELHPTSTDTERRFTVCHFEATRGNAHLTGAYTWDAGEHGVDVLWMSSIAEGGSK